MIRKICLFTGNILSGQIILPNFVPGPCEANMLKNGAPLTFTQREKHFSFYVRKGH